MNYPALETIETTITFAKARGLKPICLATTEMMKTAILQDAFRDFGGESLAFEDNKRGYDGDQLMGYPIQTVKYPGYLFMVDTQEGYKIVWNQGQIEYYIVVDGQVCQLDNL